MDLKLRLSAVKDIYLTKCHFFYKIFRDIRIIIDIKQALITEGVNPVKAIKNIKNIAVISFIFRFEAFIMLRQLVSPIII